MIKLAVFDFDGTIADTLRIILDAFEEIMQLDYKLDDTDIARFKNMPYKDILSHFGIKLHRVPGLVIKGRSVLNKNMQTVKPFTGIGDALKKLHSSGYRLAIISSNSTENIKNFLRKHDLDQYFDDVQGNIGLLGKTKSVTTLRKRQCLDASEVVYVGDEPRDIDAAKKAKVYSVAVTWGFSGDKILSKHKPFALVQTPAGLVQCVQNIGS